MLKIKILRIRALPEKVYYQLSISSLYITPPIVALPYLKKLLKLIRVSK